MQFLLTEEELQTLTERGEKRDKALADTVQSLCTQVAKYRPVHVAWRDGPDKPWGCILDPVSQPGYCDHCPVQDHCPYPHKEWSK